jgi:tetratricopeptide (TPR) repeat protein
MQSIRFPLCIIITLWIIASPAVSHCRSETQFWTPLTPFEIKVLRNADAARVGEPNTLLALALIASGDTREQRTYDRIRNRIHAFIQQNLTSIEHRSSIYAKGETLLHAAHAAFFAGGKNGQGQELIGGYDSDQSKVSTVIENGKFNCISSAIFYAILARYFNLTVQGVMTTQHAFIQIQAEDGQFIEVETTSKKGYGLVHDRKFFEQNLVRFSLSRDLSVPTYEEYLKRRVVSPFRLITENMNHQHTTSARMSTRARYRLYEIRGYLDPESVSAQLNRLKALHNGCIELFKHKDQTQIEKMVQVLEPVLRHVKNRPWIKQTQNRDVALVRKSIGHLHAMLGQLRLAGKSYDAARQHFSEGLRWSDTKDLNAKNQTGLYKTMAYQAFHNHQWKAAIQGYQKLLKSITDTNQAQAWRIKKNIAAAYWNWANEADQKKDWTIAAKRYASIANWTQDADTLRRAESAGKRSTAMYYFDHQKWAEAIQHFNQALSVPDPDNAEVIRENIGAAYINWGNALFNRQTYGPALDKYEAALEKVQTPKQQLIYKNIAAAYHNMTVPLLKKKQVGQAAAILETGVKRFPDCAPCRKEAVHLRRQAQKMGRKQ